MTSDGHPEHNHLLTDDRKDPIMPPIGIHIRAPDNITRQIAEFVLETTRDKTRQPLGCRTLHQLLCIPWPSSNVTNHARAMCIHWSKYLDKKDDCTIPALIFIMNMLNCLDTYGEHRACEYIASIVSDYKRCNKKLLLFAQSILKRPEYERAIVCAHVGQDIDYVLMQHITFENKHQRDAVLKRYNIHL